VYIRARREYKDTFGQDATLYVGKIPARGYSYSEQMVLFTEPSEHLCRKYL